MRTRSSAFVFINTVALFIACFMLSACNTVQGVGKDVQSAGDAIERAAK